MNIVGWTGANCMDSSWDYQTRRSIYIAQVSLFHGWMHNCISVFSLISWAKSGRKEERSRMLCIICSKQRWGKKWGAMYQYVEHITISNSVTTPYSKNYFVIVG